MFTIIKIGSLCIDLVNYFYLHPIAITLEYIKLILGCFFAFRMFSIWLLLLGCLVRCIPYSLTMMYDLTPRHYLSGGRHVRRQHDDFVNIKYLSAQYVGGSHRGRGGASVEGVIKKWWSDVFFAFRMFNLDLSREEVVPYSFIGMVDTN
jgi:hypothetical protein